MLFSSDEIVIIGLYSMQNTFAANQYLTTW